MPREMCLLVALVAGLCACDALSGPAALSRDGGPSECCLDAGTPEPRCEDDPTCLAPGARCEGRLVVRCERSSQGCLVASLVEDCAQRPRGFCDVATATCAQRPCSPSVCDEAAPRCDGSFSVRCGAGEAGCFEELDRRDCRALPRGECSPETGLCVQRACPRSPCEAEGDLCEDTTLRRCALDAQGCPVLATQADCASIPRGRCEDGACVQLECPPTRCLQAGLHCAGNESLRCELDAEGCLRVRTRDPCDRRPRGACDPVSGECILTPCPPTRCDRVGASCVGATRLECELDAQVCLAVVRETACDAVPRGVCQSGGCEQPPCPDTPCEEEGWQCVGQRSLRCERNADDCLAVVEAVTCGGSARGPCKPEIGRCGELPCADNDCTQAGHRCEGNRLLSCSQRADGCWLETLVRDCQVFGRLCDPARRRCIAPRCPPSECRSEGQRCQDSRVLECRRNANGCWEQTLIDNCGNSGQRYCTSPPPRCIRCPDDDRCDSEADFCSGDVRVVCEALGPGCFAAETVEDCSSVGAHGGRCEAPPGRDARCRVCPNPCQGEACCNGRQSTHCADADTLIRCRRIGDDNSACWVPSEVVECSEGDRADECVAGACIATPLVDTAGSDVQP